MDFLNSDQITNIIVGVVMFGIGAFYIDLTPRPKPNNKAEQRDLNRSTEVPFIIGSVGFLFIVSGIPFIPDNFVIFFAFALFFGLLGIGQFVTRPREESKDEI